MIKYEKFPVRHVEGNLVFGADGTVWAYFLLNGFNYDLRDHNGKMEPFDRQMAFFKENIGDLHFSVVPVPTNTDTILNHTIDQIKDKNYPLQQHGIAYMEAIKDALRGSNIEIDSTEYNALLGVQIRKHFNHVKDSNAGNAMIQSFSEFVKGLKSPLYRAVGLQPFDILQKEIEDYQKDAVSIQKELEKFFNCEVEEVTTKQMIFFMEQHYTVGKQEIPIREDFQSAETVEGTDLKGKKHKAKRPNPKAFFDIQNAEVQEVDRRTLLVQREVDHEIEETYVRYFICDKITGAPEHPGWEWMYKVQNRLNFPVAFSIRAHHVNNEKTLSVLSNALLSIDDQKNEAKKVGEAAEDDVYINEKGAVRMQTLFKKNGWCSYNCSFLFKVSAKDLDTLNANSKTLVAEMKTFGMSLITPFGEQMNFFNESMLGSRRYSNDYNIKGSPHLLAGLMFGATTHLGDYRGFYLGQTLKQNRPVFVQLDLAAKNYKHIKTMFDSISVMVAGMTGKGKSVLMNLLAYLAVLMGSLALVIDPKADRRKWGEGLPYIPKEFISTWMLGESKDDAGCLDPWRICSDPEEARDLCIENVSHMADIKIGDLYFTLLNKYVDEVMKQEDPCMGALLDHVQKLESELGVNSNDPRAAAIIHLSGTLQSIKSNQLGRLLFSEVGQKTRSLAVDKPLQVLMIHNLQLPKDGKPATTPQGKFSEMVMLSLTAFTKQYMLKQDRYRHKIILQDEAASIERSATGSVLLDFVVSQGRYYNTTLLKGTQNATSFGSDTNNIGMKFSLALPNEKEATQMLKFMNLPLTDDNIKMLQRLDNGQALFQDSYGRCATMYINPVFGKVLEAFDTSTSTKEEKEKEELRYREKVGV